MRTRGTSCPSTTGFVVGFFDDQEAAALAVNAAIRWAGLEGHRKTNPVDADGRVVPRA